MYRKPVKMFIVAILLITFVTNLHSIQAGFTCNVHWNLEKQTIDGFGGSGAFRQAANLMAYPETERELILDLLFSQDKGIGLSIVRNIIGDGGDWGQPIDGPTPSIEPQEGVWNWTGDEDQIWLMNEAKKRGCHRFVSTVWSPPAWMKTNNSVIKGGALRPDKYQAYADYLSNYVRGYQEHHQIKIEAISLANEPGFAAPYSSCLWTGIQFRDFIKDYLTPTLKRNNIAVKVIIPEEMNFSEAYAIETLNDSQACQGIDIIGTHAYDFKANPFPVAKSRHKSIWQTEVSNIGFNDGSINDGLKYAKLLHDHLTITEVNAWLFWWLIAYKEGETLVHLDLEGVKLRYFYTSDSEAPQQLEYSGGSIPKAMVTGAIVKMKSITPQANFCLEIGFNKNAGVLEPKQEVQLLASLSAKGGVYRQDNDFSFNSGRNGLMDWETVAGYIDEKLCWGREPSLLVNSGFEDGTTGWFNFGGPSRITVTTDTAHTGATSLLISGRTETWQGVAQDLSPVMKPGATYEVSAWIKLKNKPNDAGRISIKRSDDRGDNYTWVESKTVSDEEWTCISGLYQLDVVGPLKALQLYTEGPGPGVDYYVDNVTVRQVPAENFLE